MIYRFEEFVLDPATRELRRDNAAVPLPARAFDCLAYLLEHRERAVGRDELIAAVWGRVEVSDALLGHTIVKIRRALGDTGDEQRTVRTVPRFGYRWAMPVDVAGDPGPVDAQTVAGADIVASPATDGPFAPTSDVAIAPGAREARSAAWIRKLALPCLLLVVAIVVVLLSRRDPAQLPVAASRPERAADAAAGDDGMATAALVLPAEVDAPEDSQWLRYGVMDLVANRLRGSALPTMPSESVVGLLRQRVPARGNDLLHDPALVDVAALRVLPQVSSTRGRWHVRLEAFGSQRALDAQAEAADAIVAARAATDELLRKLGRTPVPGGARTPALDDLLQRSGAAMLADQLEQASDLIAAAPVELRQQPAVEHRMAQIELRKGDYAAAGNRMRALLDRRDPAIDESLRVRAMLTQAAAQMRAGHVSASSELYDEAIAIGTRLADHEVLGVARLGRGAALAQEGRHDEATTLLARARTDLATIGDGLGVASVDVNLGEFMLARHRPADALPLIERAVAEFERLGAREGRAYALGQQVAVELELLDVDAALATSARLLPVEVQTRNERLRWNVLLARAMALAASGSAADALTLLVRIDAGADPRLDAVVRAQASLAAAELARSRGDTGAVSEPASAALVAPLRDADPTAWTRALVLQAGVQRARGDLAGAAATTASLREWADAKRDDWRAMHATAAEAAQAAAEHRRGVALELYARAMASAGRASVPADLVAIGVPYLDLLVESSQLDEAQAVAGRIAPWSARIPEVASAQARMYRALGQEDAARDVEAAATRPRSGRGPDGAAHRDQEASR